MSQVAPADGVGQSMTAVRSLELDSLLEQHRVELTGYCYRMLGSAFEADDAVQETLLHAWRNLGPFEGRAAVRTWLYRIATNVCLDMLADRSRGCSRGRGPVAADGWVAAGRRTERARCHEPATEDRR
jgi:RNA polymerase sigma factor (sigma-70 family)